MGETISPQHPVRMGGGRLPLLHGLRNGRGEEKDTVQREGELTGKHLPYVLGLAQGEEKDAAQRQEELTGKHLLFIL